MPTHLLVILLSTSNSTKLHTALKLTWIFNAKKIYLGKGVRYYPKKKIGEFIIESGSLKAEDNLLIIGPNYGIVREKGSAILVNGAMSKQAIKGDHVTIPLEDKVTPYDKLYKLVE